MNFKLTSALLWPIVVLIIAFGAFFLRPWEPKTKETISVSAMGKTEVAPNIAKISASIETTNSNLDTARQENEKKISTVIDALKKLGVDQKDIKTQYLSGGPGYEPAIAPDKSVTTQQSELIYPPSRPNTNQVTTTLEITIRNFDISDEVLASLTQNGATNLYGPNLTISDELLEEAKGKAREDAVENAKEKGNQLAKLSNTTIGKAVKIQELGDYGYPVPMLARGEADLKSQASQIQPGQNEVTVNLQVDFQLK